MRGRSTNTLAIEKLLSKGEASRKALVASSGLPGDQVRIALYNLVRGRAVTYEMRHVPWALRPVAFYKLAVPSDPASGGAPEVAEIPDDACGDAFAALARAMRPSQQAVAA